jgi:hypothetical protein
VRLYDVTVAALAIDAPSKWVDNLLSHHKVPGILSARRGVARRISRAALMHLSLTRELHVELRLSVRDALTLAGQLLATTGDPVHRSGHVRVTFDRVTLERALDDRLRDALESAPAPRRGRPPASRPTDADRK